MAKSDTSAFPPGVSAAITAVVVVVVLLWNRRNSQKRKEQDPLSAPPVIPNHPMIVAKTVQRSRPDEGVRELVPIQLVRELMGPSPRAFDSSIASYIHVDPPFWLEPKENDEMRRVFSVQERVRRDGKVVWGAIVQANTLIFNPGPVDHGASVIWSEDPYFDIHPEELLGIARELFGLKGSDQADPETSSFARMLANEMIRAPRLKVPTRFTNGRAVYHSSLMLTRKHLVMGYLAQSLMPIWIDPEPTGNVLLVPAAYWPASLIQWWKSVENVPEESPASRGD